MVRRTRSAQLLVRVTPEEQALIRAAWPPGTFNTEAARLLVDRAAELAASQPPLEDPAA